jgi:hypothetical protein
MEENQNQEGQQAASSNNEELTNKFTKERKYWSDLVKSMSEKMRDIYSITDLQVEAYSQRQIAAEYAHTLAAHMVRLNKMFRAAKIERWEHYTRNYDLRMDKEPKELHIYKDLAVLVEKREAVQNHLEYMRETVRSIDTICYGIKHRIALEEYRRS